MLSWTCCDVIITETYITSWYCNNLMKKEAKHLFKLQTTSVQFGQLLQQTDPPLGAAGGRQEPPEAGSRHHEHPGAPRSRQEPPGAMTAPGSARRHQEALGRPRTRQEPPGATHPEPRNAMWSAPEHNLWKQSWCHKWCSDFCQMRHR